MPPTVPRKRLQETSPSSRASGRAEVTPPSKRRKATLYDDLDATSTSTSKGGKEFLESLDTSDESDSLTDLSDADFEDVVIPRGTAGPASARGSKQNAGSKENNDDEEDDEEDEDAIEFEDVAAPQTSMIEKPGIQGDLELTLHRDTRLSLTNPFDEKKGPSKIERKIRNATHCVHVQSLLWHNAVRNAWLCDQEVQAIMLSHLPPGMAEEVDRWRKASGLDIEIRTHHAKKPTTAAKKRRRSKVEAPAVVNSAGSREWAAAAGRLETGVVDMSHGDPLYRLIKSLASWWRQRFKITAPGLRKQGYMSLERIDRLTKAWATASTASADPSLFGERIQNLDEFRQRAMLCSGSRDVGAQLFTALLRALGLEARMIASLQPLGFGWTKMEEAQAETDMTTLAIVKRQKAGLMNDGTAQETQRSSRSELADGLSEVNKARPGRVGKGPGGVRSTRNSTQFNSVAGPETSEDLEVEHPDSDADSVLEIDMTTKTSAKEETSFDRDLEFPHYWTEVLSPVTKTYLPVDPIVKKIVATNRELVETLEPRGGKADRARQVIAYVVGYSPDGTAKDVTVRYLKRHVRPGRTKGMRMPVERIPVHDRNGKVKRHDQRDWFKTAMSGYVRGSREHPLTEVDEMEDSTDLKAAQLEKKPVKDGEETLQFYKQSTEFCLERHLKREEALIHGAQPIKMFRVKAKGRAKANSPINDDVEEPVFSRKDVVNVKSAETWHKQGRAPRPGQQALKRVPYRAATTNRRREIAEAEALSGEKVLQGLYSMEQTEWIIPPPIKDGIIPKNEYGNIDLFAEHMCPEGAVHIPYRGAVKVCKGLGIDYAEAVVDFEFGHRMAVPVIQGIVCAAEYYDQVVDQVRKNEEEKTRKQDEKKRKEMLRLWSKFIKGLRIVERIREDYGHIRDDADMFQPQSNQPGKSSGQHCDVPGQSVTHDEDMGGGFLLDDDDQPNDEHGLSQGKKFTSNFFPVPEEDDDGPGDLMVDNGDGADSLTRPPGAAVVSPVSSVDGKRVVPRRSTRHRGSAYSRGDGRDLSDEGAGSGNDSDEYVESS